MPKKAQITLFIILGIVIVIAALIVIYVQSNLIKTTEGETRGIIKQPYKSTNVKRRVRAEPKFYLKLIEKDKSILNELKK